MSVRAELDREDRAPVRLDRRALRSPEWGRLGVRAAFGGGIALAAGLVGMRLGPTVGGLFLAFPVVLPAALTLIEKSSGEAATDVDAVGATIGALAIIVFAVVAALLLRPAGPAAIALAAAAWIVVALGVFWLVRRIGR